MHIFSRFFIRHTSFPDLMHITNLRCTFVSILFTYLYLSCFILKKILELASQFDIPAERLQEGPTVNRCKKNL